MTCCSQFISSTTVSVSGTEVVIQIPTNTFNNGDLIRLLVAQDIPSALGTNTVSIQIGSSTTTYPLIKRCGDNVRGDQIRRNTIYNLYVGTSPGHFMVRNSQCLPSTSYVSPQISSTTTTVSATSTTVTE